MTIVDASRVLASCCPAMDTATTIDGTGLIGVMAPADGRRAAWRVTLFFGANARGILNLYKGILGDTTIIISDFPLFLLLLVSIQDILALVSPRLPFKLLLLPVLLHFPLCLVQSTIRRPHGLAPWQWC